MILTHACPFIVSSPVIVTTLFAAKLYSRSFDVRGSFSLLPYSLHVQAYICCTLFT